MLTLGRKRGQGVWIMKDGQELCFVKVIEVPGAQGGQVKLGFEADPAVTILREEIAPNPKPS